MGQKWVQMLAQQGQIAAGESQISGERNGLLEKHYFLPSH